MPREIRTVADLPPAVQAAVAKRQAGEDRRARIRQLKGQVDVPNPPLAQLAQLLAELADEVLGE